METEIITKEQEEFLNPEVVSLVKGEGYHLTHEITALKVSNEKDYLKAVELGTANKRVLNQLENFRKMIVKPLNDQIKNINGMFKKISERFNKNDEVLRNGIGRYQASRKNTESIQNVNTETGRATIQERWTYEILNPDLVPRDWCVPDEVRIGKAVRAGALRELPGVKIYKEKITAFAA